MSNLDSLFRRLVRLEAAPPFIPQPKYGLVRVPLQELAQLSEQDRNLWFMLSNRGVDEEAAYMQLTELSTKEIEALQPIAQRLDAIKQQPLA